MTQSRMPTVPVRPRPRQIGAATLAVLAAVVAMIVPSAALAASPQTFEYPVTVKPLALAQGKTVQTKVVVTAPEPTVKDWWSQATVSKVVRKGVNGGYQRPYQAEGYRCTATVKGENTSFACTLKGADVPTKVRLTFSVVYRGSTPSG